LIERNRASKRSGSGVQRALFLLALMGGAIAYSVPTNDIVIIVNPTVKTREISVDDLRAIFLETKTSLDDGSRVKPVLEKGGPAHAAFLKAYLGKTDFALQTYYRSLVFSGTGSMPPVLRSDGDVVAYVEKTRGAIGYVAAQSVDEGVKTIRVR